MAFDPDAYLSEKLAAKAEPAFDPDAYIKAKGIAPSVSKMESGLRGAAQGATFGFAPAIAGAVDAAPDALSALIGNESMNDVTSAYRKGRDASGANFKAAQEANPLTSLAGNVVGGLAPALLSGGATEGLSALETGAAMGGLSGLGDAVSSGKDLVDSAKDVGMSAAGGGLLGGAIGKLSGLAGGLKGLANERALKATGIGKGQLKNLLKGDVKANAYKASVGDEAQDSVAKLGSNLLEKNIYQDAPLVSAGSTPEHILDKAQDLSEKSGQAIGDVLKKFDENYSLNDEHFFNPAAAVASIKQELLSPLQVNGSVPPLSEGPASTIQKVIDTLNQYGDRPVPFQTAQDIKQLLKSNVSYDSEGSEKNQILKKVSGIINEQIEQAADNVAQSSGKPDLIDTYLKAKELYGTANTAINASVGKVAGNMVNRDFGLTDYLAAGAGAATHGNPGLVIGAIGNKLLKTYGNSVIASGANNLSNMISATTGALTKAPKEMLHSLGQSLLSSGGNLEAKLGNVLISASEKDSVGRNALVFSLMQNPGYRKLLQSSLGHNIEEKK